MNVLKRWQEDLRKAHAAADVGNEILLRHFGQVRQIDRKINQSLVSEADLQSEMAIKQTLDDGSVSFLAEESGATGQTDRRWVIDPLDGTTNYLHGLPFFAISLALEENGEVVVGLIDLPLLQSRYWAIKGQGSRKNGDPIHVSQRAEDHEILLATGFSTWDFADLETQLLALAKVVQATRGVRRFGSAAMDLCWVAEGIFDGFWEKKLQPWDTAAGALIVREAGGQVTDYSNKYFHFTDESVIASNGRVHPRMLDFISGRV